MPTIAVALGKRSRLGTKGLEKTTSAHMTLERVELRSFNDLDSLIDLLAGISVSQALCSSVPKGGVRSAPIVTKSELLQRPVALASTTECFEFPSAPCGGAPMPVQLCPRWKALRPAAPANSTASGARLFSQTGSRCGRTNDEGTIGATRCHVVPVIWN